VKKAFGTFFFREIKMVACLDAVSKGMEKKDPKLMKGSLLASS
jgi:hypothetical protein